MGLKKHGVGDVVGTDEKGNAKTASKSEWTEDDQRELEEESKD